LRAGKAKKRTMYVKTLALNSRSSLAEYPDNTPTDFVNLLPERLTSSDRKKPLWIRPVAISLATEVYSKRYHIWPNAEGGAAEYSNLAGGGLDVYPRLWQFPGYIEIFLNEATAQVRGDGYQRCIGGFAFPPKDLSPPVHAQQQRAEFSLHRFQHAGWTKLRANDVTQFGVKLASTTGSPFMLHNPLEDPSDSTPTILELEVTDDEAMATKSGVITIGCTSWHPDNFPKNTHADFHSALPYGMSFPNYEVALTRIVYPPNLRQGMLMRFWINGHEFRFDAEKDFQYNGARMVNQVHAAIQGTRFAGHITCKMVGRLRDNNQRVAFTRGANRTMRQALFKIQLDKYFVQVLGLWPDETTHYMRPGQGVTLAGDAPAFSRLHFNPTAMLECDCVDFAFVGEKQFRLMQFVPVLSTELARLSPSRASLEAKRRQDSLWKEVRELVYEPETLDWKPFTGRLIENIGFKFREPDGSMKTFTADPGAHNAILITLRLRPRPVVEDAAPLTQITTA